MALGNKGFADLVANADGVARATSARLPPRTGILGARDNRLAELASGAVVSRLHEAVDPARCRVWEGHNRDYAALNEKVCADLIESFRSQGRQEVPAIVRRVTGDVHHDFEVICGARRHWTVSWMRDNTYPDFKFLIEPRELTDEEAFRLADLENRSRKDLSDYERATDYARAIDRYYGGSQQKMVERLEVSKSWLSRYLELARLPQEVIASFGSPHVIGISHAAVLAPLLRVPKTREHMLTTAVELAEEQAAALAAGKLLPPALIVRRLTQAGQGRRAKCTPKEVTIAAKDGSVLAKGSRSIGGSVAITIPDIANHARVDVLQAVADILGQIVGKAES